MNRYSVKYYFWDRSISQFFFFLNLPPFLNFCLIPSFFLSFVPYSCPFSLYLLYFYLSYYLFISILNWRETVLSFIMSFLSFFLFFSILDKSIIVNQLTKYALCQSKSPVFLMEMFDRYLATALPFLSFFLLASQLPKKENEHM